MSYTIDSVEILKNDNARMRVGDILRLVGEINVDDLPIGGGFLVEIAERIKSLPVFPSVDEEVPVVTETSNSVASHSRFSWCGEGAHYGTIETLTDKIAPFIRGTLEVVFTWERGDSFSGLRLLVRQGADAPDGDLSTWVDAWVPRLTRTIRHGGNLKYCWALDRRAAKSLPASKPYEKLATFQRAA